MKKRKIEDDDWMGLLDEDGADDGAELEDDGTLKNDESLSLYWFMSLVTLFENVGEDPDDPFALSA